MRALHLVVVPAGTGRCGDLPRRTWSRRRGHRRPADVQPARLDNDLANAAINKLLQDQAPGCLITFFLLLFGIIPGLLYWIAAKRTLTVSVTAQPVPRSTGAQVSVAWSRNGGGRGPSLEFQNLLAPGAQVAMVDGGSSSTLRAGIEEVTDGALSASAMRPQSAAAAPAAGAEVAPVATMAFCPNCGSAVSEGHAFCPTCGKALKA